MNTQQRDNLAEGWKISVEQLACERASFELSRERAIRVESAQGPLLRVMTVEALLLTSKAPCFGQHMLPRSAQLIVSPGRATALGLPDQAVALDVAGMTLPAVTALAGLDGEAIAPLATRGRAAKAGRLHAALLALARMAGRAPALVVFEQEPGEDLDSAVLQIDGEIVIEGLRARAVTFGRPKYLLSVNLPLTLSERTRLHLWRDAEGRDYHALEIGDKAGAPPLVRLHSECFTGDFLGSQRCDCEVQLMGALERISSEGHGLLIYLPQEGRGIGLTNKLRTYRLQEQGLDTYSANRALGFGEDERNFGAGASILQTLGMTEIDLLSNNPDKAAGLAREGVRVRKVVPHAFAPNRYNTAYVQAKRIREKTASHSIA